MFRLKETSKNISNLSFSLACAFYVRWISLIIKMICGKKGIFVEENQGLYSNAINVWMEWLEQWQHDDCVGVTLIFNSLINSNQNQLAINGIGRYSGLLNRRVWKTSMMGMVYAVLVTWIKVKLEMI